MIVILLYLKSITMKNLSVHIKISPELYTKNPESTELGQNIVSESIAMIDALGFESFTFKKLGVAINSNESSIYRYFSSKHALLVYLVSWYWSWIEYKLVFATNNVSEPKRKLQIALEILTNNITEDNSFSYINEVTLHRIIIAESAKAYHTKDIDKENEKGFYKTFKRVVSRVSDLVLEVNPTFEFPHMLISTVIEGSHHQRYFSKHLPSLTDVEEGKNNIVRFYTDLVFKTIQK
ncbi:TetR/AcrR family transcriptional regulator [Spongiimicrobium salis]|uniref:TetR/AcrR family transcriptional regulator n=1 Tax=Spongiimicrobium salis TaxID=1667022 RepID=UPI00374CA85D